MPLTPSTLIVVKRIPGKGRGVFAQEFIPEGTVFERVPMLVMSQKDFEDLGEDHLLTNYIFAWGKRTVGLALGFGSLYNHSYKPNARYDDVSPQIKIFTALRDIEPGEEITVNYNGDPDDRSKVWFDVL